MAEITLAFGGNLNNVINSFRKAIHLLNINHVILCKNSSIYTTAPIGCEPTALSFKNMVALFETNLSPLELLDLIHHIEFQLGRPKEHAHWVSREIDIDILTYDDLIMQTEKLTIPHPLMCKRDFVLVPLLEIINKTRYMNSYAAIPKSAYSIISKEEFIL